MVRNKHRGGGRTCMKITTKSKKVRVALGDQTKSRHLGVGSPVSDGSHMSWNVSSPFT